MKLLILLVVVVGVVALAQLARVYELSAKLRKRREEDISHADNRLNASLFIVFMLAFYAGTIYLYAVYGDYLPTSASEHGVGVDALMSVNIWIITAVFFLVNTLLFVFTAKYYYKKDRKAKFFPHDNRLEMIWTVIPSIVLAGIIIFGLRTWNDMTGEASDDAILIELYSKQFDWTARYAGANDEFGVSNFNLITSNNPLGIVTNEGINESLAELDAKIEELETTVNYERGVLVNKKKDFEKQLKHLHEHHAGHGHADEHAEEGHGDDHGHDGLTEEQLKSEIAKIEEMLKSDKVSVLSDVALEAKQDKLYRLKRHKQRVLDIENFDFSDEQSMSAWEAGKDDKIVKGEFHLPIGKEVEFVFRSRDVIHSAYMPHFRTQMNCVPGTPTRFKMTPTITTDSMRTIMDDPEFNYVLLCNKVCGSAHFNMQMKVIVESQEDYDNWLNEQKTFFVEEVKEEEAPAAPVAEGEPTASIN